ncbi:MAG: NADPH-dependent assimilatory sulfite reductase hemoprotein subunit [Planctomycetes bacterium]|nr:NADPH-dependent assimilatory sulfite reductase hemoprotein subunit [Planctomycetota bacterium]
MSDEIKLTKLEYLKENSHQLRGSLAEELANDRDHLSGDAAQILKFHGSYQQRDRDRRGGPQDRAYMFMIRTAIPGGRLTARQLLAEMDLSDRYGNGTLRITTRQDLQLHGIVKKNLRSTIRAINDVQLTTFGGCGDVERNVMCCPAPDNASPVRAEMQEMANRFAKHLQPRTRAYYEIWLQDSEGHKRNVTEFRPVEEPIYGDRYLPRKFKTGFALPEDNCVDVLTNDLGFIGIVEEERIVGYNVAIGGGQGMTPAVKTTFPAIAQTIGFVSPDQVLAVGEAVVKVFRDFGNRTDRKRARLKYLIADRGLGWVKTQVEEYLGQPLAEARPHSIRNAQDHLGWHEQSDGRLFVGINVENGRIQDTDRIRLKTALRTLLAQYDFPVRLTPLQSLILCDIDPDNRSAVERILADHGVEPAEQQTQAHRYAMACPALPTCGLAITESERVMPSLMDHLDAELRRFGLADLRIAVHMTGCPNGCARPYTSDIGIVGKARGRYTIYLGGNVAGTRLSFKFLDMVPLEQIVPTLIPLLESYQTERHDEESFGDFCVRKGRDALLPLLSADSTA